jgi:MFS family permease
LSPRSRTPATAIPKITADFNSLNDVGWYGSSYLLTTTALQPSFGKIYTYFDIKYTYILAVVIFEVGSVVCATAPNSTALIIGRAIAGLGAAGLFSGGITIVGYSVPLRRRAMYIAIISSTFGIASIIGPILGGILTDKLSWRFCFWINLPVGGIAIITTGLFFTSPPRRNAHLSPMEKLRQMDLGGAFVLICGICCLLLALQWGGTTYPWHDSRVWGTLLGFVLLIIVFIALQLWIGDHATIPLRIISNRGVAVGTTFSMFMNFSIFLHVFFLPFYFQACLGTTAEGSGIRSIPYLVSNTLASIVVGTCVTVFGPYTPYLWLGSAIFTVGAGMLYRLQVDSSAAVWIGYQLIAGIGAGCAIQIPFIAVQALLDPADMPTGNALTIFFNTLGGAFSVSVGQNIFSNELAKQLEASVPPIVLEIVNLAGSTGLREAVPPQDLPAVLQSYNDAVTRTFIIPIVTGGIAFLISLWMPWGTVKGKNLLMGAA